MAGTVPPPHLTRFGSQRKRLPGRTGGSVTSTTRGSSLRFTASSASRVRDQDYGPWAAGLAALLFAVIMIFMLAVSSGERGGDTCFSNLWLALPILLAGICGALAGGITLIATVRHGGRSVIDFAALLLELSVLFFVAGELAGHAEPEPDGAPEAIKVRVRSD